MLIERNARVRAFEQFRQYALSLLDRLRPQVLAVELKEIERA
jgi:hypothetical protein